MVRTEVELTDEEAAGLEKLASERKTSVPECIHEGVKLVLGVWGKRDTREARQRAKQLAGMFRSQTGDLSVRHDDYFAEACEGCGGLPSGGVSP
jgi:Arc/MetJ-type ribon-helix-helix transcriptional regulator